MRHTHYFVYYREEKGSPVKLPFVPMHFDEAKVSGFPGISSADLATGMPNIAALTLVNKWNRQNHDSGFTYWVE
jgi:hypothetical protein